MSLRRWHVAAGVPGGKVQKPAHSDLRHLVLPDFRHPSMAARSLRRRPPAVAEIPTERVLLSKPMRGSKAALGEDRIASERRASVR